MPQDEGIPILTPEIGATVVTTDGHELGTVKAIDREFFQVDAPLSPDYWLNRSIIDHLKGGRVILQVREEALEHQRLAEVPPSGETAGQGTGPHDEAPTPEDARGDPRFLGPGIRTG